MSFLEKLCPWKKAQPEEIETGWVEDISPVETGGGVKWNLRVRFPSEPGAIFGDDGSRHQEVSCGAKYWALPLGEDAVRVLRHAKELRCLIRYDSSAFRKYGHRVPWQGFRKAG